MTRKTNRRGNDGKGASNESTTTNSEDISVPSGVAEFTSKDLELSLQKFLYENSVPKLNRMFESVEKSTGMRRDTIAFVLLAVLTFYVTFGEQRKLVSDVVCFVYPAYLTLKVIREPSPAIERRLMIYWIVFSVLQLLESPSDDKSTQPFPFYFLIKTMICIYMMHPATHGTDNIDFSIMMPLANVADMWVNKMLEE